MNLKIAGYGERTNFKPQCPFENPMFVQYFTVALRRKSTENRAML